MLVIDCVGQTWFYVGAAKGRVVGPVICGAGIGARCVPKSRSSGVTHPRPECPDKGKMHLTQYMG